MANKEEVAGKIYIHDSTAAILVEDALPTIHTFESSLSFLGTFEPIRQNTIGSDAQGKIIKLEIQEGDRVNAGQLLAKIDDEMILLQLQNLEVSIEGQEKDDERYSNLANNQVIPGVQLEKNKLGLKASSIQKKQLMKQLKSTSVLAPFSGVITKKLVDLGSVVGGGLPLFEITDVSKLKLTVNVPERDILKFKLNQTVQVAADIYSDRKFEGKVSNISVQADKSHNFKVQITVENGKQELMAGMYGSISLSNNMSTTALAIPRSALIGSTKNPQVYLNKNGKAILTSFSAGTSDGDFIEVISGIEKSDRIIVKGQVNLQNNSNVKTKK
jgi:RND family efflux transporter MFP subunit